MSAMQGNPSDRARRAGEVSGRLFVYFLFIAIACVAVGFAVELIRSDPEAFGWRTFLGLFLSWVGLGAFEQAGDIWRRTFPPRSQWRATQ
jgi:hypothetical protein